MTNKINDIDVSKYFTNHYDNEGKLYAVEYKGNPLELQNAIKRLQQQIEAYQLSENEAKEIIAELEHKNKYLQEENERLQMLSCANCGEKYLSPDGAELYDENVQLQEELDIKEKMLDKFMIGSGETLEKLQKENEKLRQDWRLDCLKCEYKNTKADVDKYKKALEKIIDIAEKLITETPEYNSCYYKDECGDNCTPKKQSKVEYCCYENVDKILTIIDEVLK